jgi:hypothetical protein
MDQRDLGRYGGLLCVIAVVTGNTYHAAIVSAALSRRACQCRIRSARSACARCAAVARRGADRVREDERARIAALSDDDLWTEATVGESREARDEWQRRHKAEERRIRREAAVTDRQRDEAAREQFRSFSVEELLAYDPVAAGASRDDALAAAAELYHRGQRVECKRMETPPVRRRRAAPDADHRAVEPAASGIAQFRTSGFETGGSADGLY